MNTSTKDEISLYANKLKDLRANIATSYENVIREVPETVIENYENAMSAVDEAYYSMRSALHYLAIDSSNH